MQRFRYLLLLLIFLAVQRQSRANIYEFNDEKDAVLISASSFQYALSNEVNHHNVSFQPYDKEILDFGLVNTAVWLKFTIQNDTKDNALKLFIPVAHLDSIALHRKSSSRIDDSGDIIEAELKDIIDPYHTISLTLEPGSTET